MNDVPSRWFETSEVEGKLRYIVSKLRSRRAATEEASQSRQFNRTQATIFAFVGSTAAIGVLVGALVMFAKPEPGKQANYPAAVLLCLTVIGGATAATYSMTGANNEQRESRDRAIQSVCESVPGYHFSGRREIEECDVGTIPWFVSEEWIHMFGLMVGERSSSEFILTDCHQIIDPILTTTDSKLVQGASQLVSKKHQRLYRREFEAVVFTQELTNVCDLVIVPKTDANRAYYKRALHGQQCDVANFYKLPKPLSRKYWVAAANPDQCAEILSDEFIELIAKRKWCTVQVIGGRCVVMTAQWHGNRPATAPRTEEAISENLDFAGRILDCFNGNGAGAQEDEGYSQEKVADDYCGYGSDEAYGNSSAVATLNAPVATQSAHIAQSHGKAADSIQTRTRRRRRHSVLKLFFLFGFGIPLALLGLLCTIGASITLQHGDMNHTWPQVQGTVTHSAVDVSGTRYRPDVHFEYEVHDKTYENDKVICGDAIRTKNRAEVERVLAVYPVNAQVTVYHHPQRHGVSVLEPGFKNRSAEVVGRNVGVGMLGFGLLLCLYGVAGKKDRNAVHHG